ncbi:MAG: hypothetical protein AB1468_04225 [Candidatus Micrarchaeota archaeon]
MKSLYPSYAPPQKWRTTRQAKWLGGKEWKELRQKILERDEFTCVYCGYRSEKYQIVDHADGDPENHNDSNLQIICQMCNLIKHSGQGCVIVGVVDLYRKSKYSQNDVVRITRQMRDNEASDREIINFLGLEELVPFKMDREYLRNLYGFVSSRASKDRSDMYSKWLSYNKKMARKTIPNGIQTTLAD